MVSEILRGLDKLNPDTEKLRKICTRFFVEMPILTKQALDMIKGLCTSAEKQRMVLGLKILRDLVRRSRAEGAPLNTLLSYTFVERVELRTATVRLVANQLFDKDSLTNKIQVFAMLLLKKVLDPSTLAALPPIPPSPPSEPSKVPTGTPELGAETSSTNPSSLELGKTSSPSPMKLSFREDMTDEEKKKLEEQLLRRKRQAAEKQILKQKLSAHEKHVRKQKRENREKNRIEEINRYLALYFALCTKKHALLAVLLETYSKASMFVKMRIHKQAPDMILTVGMGAPDLLKLIRSPPSGSEMFVYHILQILTESYPASSGLVKVCIDAYENHGQDAHYLMYIASALPKQMVRPALPKILALEKKKMEKVITEILVKGKPLTPSELLVSLHLDLPLRTSSEFNRRVKEVMAAIKVCFEHLNILTKEVLQETMSVMLEERKIPQLFLWLVLKSQAVCPELTKFIAEDVMPKLIAKHVWTNDVLWEGFRKCCKQTAPDCFPTLTQDLPAVQLKEVLSVEKELREPLRKYITEKHAEKPTLIRRDILIEFGLETEISLGGGSGDKSWGGDESLVLVGNNSSGSSRSGGGGGGHGGDRRSRGGSNRDRDRASHDDDTINIVPQTSEFSIPLHSPAPAGSIQGVHLNVHSHGHGHARDRDRDSEDNGHMPPVNISRNLSRHDRDSRHGRPSR